MRFLALLPLFRGHWRGLSNIDQDGNITGPDYLSRGILIVLPVAAAVAVGWFEVTFAEPSAMLSGFALLSGVLLAVFGQLTSLRLRLTDRTDESRRLRVFRDSLDESVAHVLVASVVGLAAATVIVISLVLGCTPSNARVELTGVPSIAVAFLGTYEALTLLMVIPRLYSSYTRGNKVSKELDGHVSIIRR